jgi:hypothetical protein
MSDMGWWEAILTVLRGSNEAMHYTDIADEIVNRGLRTSVGATPASTVNVYISDSLNRQGTASPFERTARGYYRLRETGSQDPSVANALTTVPTNVPEVGTEGVEESISAATKDTTGLINALGMYWSRDKINWVPGTPKLLGRQNAGSQVVDLSDQRGVYLLYDRSEVIYVGRAIDQGIGARLKQHTFDRLTGRWERFSWFGVHRVSENGALDTTEPTYDRTLLIATMEALLIESVEPSQNRKRGDEFRAVEFLQAEDPELEIIRKRAIIAELAAKL